MESEGYKNMQVWLMDSAAKRYSQYVRCYGCLDIITDGTKTPAKLESSENFSELQTGNLTLLGIRNIFRRFELDERWLTFG